MGMRLGVKILNGIKSGGQDSAFTTKLDIVIS